MPIQDMKFVIEQNHLCYNCLIPNHGVKQCRQRMRCRICGKRHDSLIHTEYNKNVTPENKERREESNRETKKPPQFSNSIENDEDRDIASHYATDSTTYNKTNILLATALVKVTAENANCLSLVNLQRIFLILKKKRM